MARRFPFPIPFGWFQVAFPDDLAPGEVTALRYWSRDLVLWRSMDGAFHLQDAYCAHLGAHIGIGGKVDAQPVLSLATEGGDVAGEFVAEAGKVYAVIGHGPSQPARTWAVFARHA